MGAYRFATTQLRGLNAAGRAADLQHALISALLERHLGSDYAGLFAEFEVRDSDTRDWFVASAPGPAPIASLPELDQSALRVRATQMIAAVRALADHIETQGAQGRNVARVLRDATIYPADDLWLYKGRPLIVNWGYQSGETVTGEISDISTPIQLPPAPPPVRAEAFAAPASVVATPWRVNPMLAAAFLWLTFILVLARLYGDLLPACGLRAPFSLFAGQLGDCPIDAADDRLVGEGLRLQRAVERAELDLVQRKRACATPGRRADNGDEFGSVIMLASVNRRRNSSVRSTAPWLSGKE